MGLFNALQQLKLRIRRWLDQMEAGSEIAKRQNPGKYQMVFSESARKSLEDMMSKTPEEMRREAEERFARVQRKLKEFAGTHPAELICDRQPLVIRPGMIMSSWDFTKADVRACCLFLKLPNDGVATLCNVLTEAADRISRNVDEFAVIEDDVTPDMVIIDADELSPDLVEMALRKWLATYSPALATVPITFLKGQEAGSLVKLSAAMNYAKLVEKGEIIF